MSSLSQGRDLHLFRHVRGSPTFEKGQLHLKGIDGGATGQLLLRSFCKIWIQPRFCSSNALNQPMIPRNRLLILANRLDKRSSMVTFVFLMGPWITVDHLVSPCSIHTRTRSVVTALRCGVTPAPFHNGTNSRGADNCQTASPATSPNCESLNDYARDFAHKIWNLALRYTL